MQALGEIPAHHQRHGEQAEPSSFGVAPSKEIVTSMDSFKPFRVILVIEWQRNQWD